MQVVGAKEQTEFEGLLRTYATQVDAYCIERQQCLMSALSQIKSTSDANSFLTACRCAPSMLPVTCSPDSCIPILSHHVLYAVTWN